MDAKILISLRTEEESSSKAKQEPQSWQYEKLFKDNWFRQCPISEDLARNLKISPNIKDTETQEAYL